MLRPSKEGWHYAQRIILFRTTDQSVQVEYDKVSIPIPQSTYEKNGYKPDFDKLPLEDESQEKLRTTGAG
jgi:hypothetical protein